MSLVVKPTLASIDAPKVLVVDDDPVVRKALTRVMRRKGLEPDIADTPAAALSFAQREEYGLVVTDFNMPGMDGIQLVQKLREAQPLASFILVTGADPKTLPVIGRDTVAIIGKPWAREQLSTAIAQGIKKYVGRSSRMSISLPLVLLVTDDKLAAERFSHDNAWPDSVEPCFFRAESFIEATTLAQDTAFHVVIADIRDPEVGMAPARAASLAPGRPTILIVPDGYDADQIMERTTTDYISESELDGPTVGRVLRYALERGSFQRTIRSIRHRDQTTGLPDLTMFRHQASRALQRTPDPQHVALILDLSRFSAVNESFGHNAGDSALQTIAARLESAFRDGDIIARTNGNQFSILAADVPAPAEALAQRALGLVAKPIRLGGEDYVLSARVGAASTLAHGFDLEILLQAAVRALDEAKRSGRHGFHVASPKDRRSVPAMQLEHELRNALKAGDYRLWYQPQVDLRSGRSLAFEALLRWEHVKGELRPPMDFIPVLEDSGLIVPVGRWVLREACKTLRNTRLSGRLIDRVCVNVSPVQLLDSHFVEDVRTVLRETDTEPGALELEITEDVLMRDIDHSVEVLNRLKDLGVRIAVDDFGKGHSSLAYLQMLPVDVLKIDRAFVAQAEKSEKSKKLMSAILAMARALDLEVVAEGVETKEQETFLISQGCDCVQGFLYRRPAPRMVDGQLMEQTGTLEPFVAQAG